MAATVVTSIEVESLLDRKRLSGLQIFVLLTCAMAAFIDGADRQGIGLVTNNFMADLHISATRMGMVFSLDNVGAVLGAIGFGMLSDRHGRKPIMVLALGFIVVFTFLTAHAKSFEMLACCRLMAGIGLGGATPGFLTLASEYVPKRLRGAISSLIFAAYPLGGAAGGLWTSYILKHYHWSDVFYIGSALPLLVMVAMIIGLPESMQYLIRHGAPQERVLRIAARIDATVASRFRSVIDTTEVIGKRAGSVRELFTNGLAMPTVFLWCIFFCTFATVKIVVIWLPSILTNESISAAQAALVQGCWNVGNVTGMLAAGAMVKKFGVPGVLTIALVLSALAIGFIGMVSTNLQLVMIVISVAGVAMGIGVSGVIAIAATIYPSENRATGVGAGIAASRFGQVVSPMLIAVLVDTAVSTQNIMVVVGAMPLVAGFMVTRFAHARSRQSAPVKS